MTREKAGELARAIKALRGEIDTTEDPCTPERAAERAVYVALTGAVWALEALDMMMEEAEFRRDDTAA